MVTGPDEREPGHWPPAHDSVRLEKQHVVRRVPAPIYTAEKLYGE
jgi:hypothetical protein